MKQLKRLNLKNSRVLNTSEMKNILGGFFFTTPVPSETTEQPWGTTFNCRCSNGANPPFRSEWTASYSSIQEYIDDINTMCINGEGTCTQA